MGYTAKHRHAPLSARKARLVIDLIRGKPLGEALNALQFSPKRAAVIIRKVVESAQANAQEQGAADLASLYVARAVVDEGPTRRKWRPRARGMATPRHCRSSHITVELDTMAAHVPAGEE